MSFTVCFYCSQHRQYIEGTTGDHIGIFSGIRTKKGKLCHSISIQSTYFARQLSVENVRVFIFVSVTQLYSSGGLFNMVAVGFSFPKIDVQSSPIFEISGWFLYGEGHVLRVCMHSVRKFMTNSNKNI